MECRICNVQGDHKIFQGREMYFGTREEFTYFQCVNCECLQLAEIPIDMSKHYPSNYYSFNSQVKMKKSNVLSNFLINQRCKLALFRKGYKVNRILRLFVDLPSELYEHGSIIRKSGIKSFNDKILDVGCGKGIRLAELKTLGFKKLLGIDPYNANDTKYSGIRILKRHIVDLSGTYDLIIFHHSFEHIANQLETLKAVVRLLAPKGTCLISIPIVPSYCWEKYGVYWVGMDPPRHFFIHSIKSIELLANRVGLELFDVVYDSGVFEIIASEQYLRGIPLYAENSYFVNPEKSVFNPEQIEMFKKEAERSNSDKRVGAADFYFKTKS